MLLQRTDGQAEGAPCGLIHQHGGNGQGADAARIGQQYTDGNREPDRHQLHRGGSRLGVLGLLGGAETADEADEALIVQHTAAGCILRLRRGSVQDVALVLFQQGDHALRQMVGVGDVPGARYIAVNNKYDFLPKQLEDKGMTIVADIAQVLRDARDTMDSGDNDR